MKKHYLIAALITIFLTSILWVAKNNETVEAAYEQKVKVTEAPTKVSTESSINTDFVEVLDAYVTDKQNEKIIENELKQHHIDVQILTKKTEPAKKKEIKNILTDRKSGIKVIKAKKKKPFTDYDLYLLSRLIYCEVGSNRDDRALYYTGSVVLNRKKAKDYPNTIYGVIHDKGQYATAGMIDGATPDNRSTRIAKELLTTGSKAPDNVIYQAEFTQGSAIYAHIGTEYFCVR